MAVEKIIIGRDREDLKKFGSEGTVYIGRHIVGVGEEAHMTNPVHMDVIKPHVVLITGKRGSGKSYSGAVIAEEMTLLPKKIKQNLSVLMIDTMGIFWSMSRPNERDSELLRQWNLKPQGMKTRLFVPKGFVEEYKNVDIDVYKPLLIPCGELTSTDWILTFDFGALDENGLGVERVIKNVKGKLGSSYSIDDIIKEIENDERMEKKTKDVLISRFEAAKEWGIFEKTGTGVNELFERGVVSVIDVSHYTRSGSGWSVRSMLVGMLARRIFQERLKARKYEEFEVIGGESKGIPMIWIIIDEAHQFCGSEKTTAATEPMLTLIKEGREPGISLVFITQMPNKLHPDALAQADIIISHKLTSEADIKALRSVMQTYVMKDIQELINSLPRQTGAAIVLDDNSERIYTLQVRPRLSWHAGGSPSAIKEKGLFE